jgi:hypothetical protein
MLVERLEERELKKGGILIQTRPRRSPRRAR